MLIKKRIGFFITRSDTIGGAQAHVLELLEYFDNKGYEVFLISPGYGVLVSRATALGIETYSIKSLRRNISFINDVKAFFEYCALVKGLKLSAISVHSFKAGLISRVASIFTPGKVYFTVHGLSHIRTANPILKLCYKYVEKFTSYLDTRTIYVSASDLEYSKENISGNISNASLIHNGVRDSVKKSRSVKSEGSSIVIVCVARFQEPKDFVTLINAIKLIETLDWKLKLVGDGVDRAKVVNIVDENNLSSRVEFLGEINNVDEVLHQSDIFVLSSKSEGFPLSVLEAMRSSLPVVASNVGGVSESVKFNTGFLFSSGDSLGLSKCLAKLILDVGLREKFGINARLLYEKEFDASLMCSKYLNLLDD